MKSQSIETIRLALRLGTFPSSTTARDLASIKTQNGFNGETALHIAAFIGKCPLGTTNADLLGPRDATGLTPLHYAAMSGKLLPETTVDDLIRARDDGGVTALHAAATAGTLPQNTTVEDLKNTCDDNGTSALYAAAHFGNLPGGTTVQELGNTKAFDGESALAVLAANQVSMVLNNTTAIDKNELLCIVAILSQKYPMETMEWAKREKNRHTEMN